MTKFTKAPPQKKSKRIWTSIKENWQLDLMGLIPFLYLVFFKFYPMYGLQIAFKDFKVKRGIEGSAWVGLKYFQKFFSAHDFTRLLGNTLGLSFRTILIGFPVPILLALVLHVCTKPKLRFMTQNVAYIPHFISVTVLVGIMNQMLNPISGLYATIYHLFGGVSTPTDIRTIPEAFRSLYIGSGIWQNMGWDTIIYIAALSAVSPELHEAAQLDGASRLQRVIHVDLPAILPTVCIMLILRCGRVMSVGYEKIYLMQNNLNLSVSEVISTYVYKIGLGKSQFSYAAAVELFNSVVNLIVICVINKIARKLSDGEQGLF